MVFIKFSFVHSLNKKLKCVILGHLDIAELLVNNSSNVSASNDYGVEPIHFAAAGGQVNIIEMLIAKGADANLKDKDGNIPLHLAAKRG